MIPRTNVTAMFRRKPRRSPFRIDHTANWHVHELRPRMIVATRIRPTGSRSSAKFVQSGAGLVAQFPPHGWLAGLKRVAKWAGTRAEEHIKSEVQDGALR